MNYYQGLDKSDSESEGVTAPMEPSTTDEPVLDSQNWLDKRYSHEPHLTENTSAITQQSEIISEVTIGTTIDATVPAG